MKQRIKYDQDFNITDYNPDPAIMENDVTFWGSAVNPFRVAQKPDKLLGIYTGWNEIYLWGSMACEVWQEDGVTPVSPLVGSLMEIGIDSPYSVQVIDNTFIVLCTVGNKRAVVKIQGRSPQIISEPIANILQSYQNVGDVIASSVFVGGVNIYLLNFPSEDVTWAYDIKTDVWSKWSSWDLELGTHKMYDGLFNCYAKAWNKHISQGVDGSLYELSRDAYDDAGDIIRSSVRTGWLDHGTWDRKRSNQLIIKLKGYNPTAATILLRWRDDGYPIWSKPIELSIQSNSQNDSFAKLNRMGMYRSRQYEFIMTDAADMALIGMEEDVVKMRN